MAHVSPSRPSNFATNSQRGKLAKALAEEAELFDNGTLPYHADVPDEEGQAEAPWIVRVRRYIDHVSTILDDGLAFENESLTSPTKLTYFLKCE